MEAEIAAIAVVQGGRISHRQLRELGLSDSAITRRAARGALYRVAPRVYAVGHEATTRQSRYWEAFLTAGDGASLSYLTSASWHDLASNKTRHEHVTLPRYRASTSAVIFHRAHLEPHQTTQAQGLRLTTGHQTIIDCADICDQRAVERMIERAELLGWLDMKQLQPQSGRHGAKTLTAAIEAVTEGPTLTDSELEEAFYAIVRHAGLPRPIAQYVEGRRRHDFYWPRLRLAVEVDGWDTHGTRTSFEDDRRRDTELLLRGIHVIRVTKRQIAREPAWIAQSLATIAVGTLQAA
jgi:very-short-patch-repair endonuclease